VSAKARRPEKSPIAYLAYGDDYEIGDNTSAISSCCSGARLATTLIHEMARTGASRGIASLCVGVGQGLATVFERDNG
jgi:hypothetical protein